MYITLFLVCAWVLAAALFALTMGSQVSNTKQYLACSIQIKLMEIYFYGSPRLKLLVVL